MHPTPHCCNPQRVAVHLGICSSYISKGGLPLPRCLCSQRVPVRGGGASARRTPASPLPPAARGTHLPPPRWSPRKRRRAAGRWLRSGRSSCGTRGRTSSWAARGPAGVRGAGRPRGGGRGSLGEALGPQGPARAAPVPFPGSRRWTSLQCSGLGGDQIASLISLTGCCGGGESRSLPPSCPPRIPFVRGVAGSASVSVPRRLRWFSGDWSAPHGGPPSPEERSFPPSCTEWLAKPVYF